MWYLSLREIEITLFLLVKANFHMSVWESITEGIFWLLLNMALGKWNSYNFLSTIIKALSEKCGYMTAHVYFKYQNPKTLRF